MTRPRLHLTAPEGWVNDPLGVTHHDGRYHVFFQHVPGRTAWAPDCRWAHASSPDLLDWRPEPVALVPGDGDEGCWSGSVVVPAAGPPAMFYTSVAGPQLEVGRVRVAHPDDDDWRSWTKGPVVAELPAGVAATQYRDPFVLHDGDRWRMVVGAGFADGTATALVHASPDLRTWTYEGELARRHHGERDPVWTGEAWECPQLFPVGDRWVLAVAVWTPTELHHEAYALGRYTRGRFVAERWGRLTYGPSAYAGTTFTDAGGNRGMLYWLRGVCDPSGGWTGALSLPHELALDGEDLVASPHRVVASLRGDPTRLGEPGGPGRCTAPGLADLEWWPGGPGAGLEISGGPGTRPGGVLRLRVEDGVLGAAAAGGEWTMPAGEHVRVVLDGPVVEVFAAGATMALPVPANPQVTVAPDGPGTVTVWPLEPARSPEPRGTGPAFSSGPSPTTR